MLLQATFLLIVFVVLAASSQSVKGDYVAAEFLTAYVLVIVGYPTTFETLSRGKTLGKMALGLRVVGDDGSPIRFRQALVRALVGVFEIWTVVLAPVGLITSIVSSRGKRVGDFFAGTYVIQERAPARQAMPPAFATVPPPLAAWAEALQVARLTDQTAEAAGSYLRRFAELSPQAREALGIQLANAVAAQVSPLPPAGTPPAAYLSAVLAVRRAQEHASFAAAQPAPAPNSHTQAQGQSPGAAPAQPTPAQPEPVLPAPAQPEAAQPEAAQPEAAQPAPARTEFAQPAPARTEFAEPATAQPPPTEPAIPPLAPPG
jgi:uncharacterized RDD family membrane protein YckC